MTVRLHDLKLSSEAFGRVEALFAEVEKERARLDQENRILREHIRLLRIQKYGPKSEKLSDDQLELLETEPGVHAKEVEAEAQEAVRTKPVIKRDHPGRNDLPAHLERRPEVVAIEGEERLCPCCGNERHIIGYEEKEVLDVAPAQYFVRVIRREKLACHQCPEGGVATAEPTSGPHIVEKGKLSDALVVDVVIKKYASHLPIYRQQADLARDCGIELSRSTLDSAVMAAGALLMPVAAAMKKDLLGGGYIQGDETPVGVQSERTRGRNHQAFEFQYSRPGGPVVFDFQMSRAREGPATFLKGFSGILQCDGYAGYDSVGAPGIVRAGCLAHARRKFHDALKVDPHDSAAADVLTRIAALYEIEAQARKTGATHDERFAIRKEKSVPLFEFLHTRIKEIASTALPSSLLGKACQYALKQWQRLGVFLQYGIVEIDQNLCENSMRPIALGRKNWLHIGSEQAGPKIAAILSVIETCKRHKIPLREYLNDVLPKLPAWPIKDVDALSPLNWKASRPPASPT